MTFRCSWYFYSGTLHVSPKWSRMIFTCAFSTYQGYFHLWSCSHLFSYIIPWNQSNPSYPNPVVVCVSWEMSCGVSYSSSVLLVTGFSSITFWPLNSVLIFDPWVEYIPEQIICIYYLIICEVFINHSVTTLTISSPLPIAVSVPLSTTYLLISSVSWFWWDLVCYIWYMCALFSVSITSPVRVLIGIPWLGEFSKPWSGVGFSSGGVDVPD